jgi:protease I
MFRGTRSVYCAMAAKLAVVFAEHGYENLELHYPRLRLKEAGFDVKVVGPEKTTYKSKEGYPATADSTVKDVDPSKVAAVVVPGGFCTDRLRRDADICSWLKAATDAGAVIAFICHGGWLPISAKIVKGKRVTCFVAIKDDLINAGADYVDERVVVDGRMVTAQTPDDLPGFMTEILKIATEQ